MAYALHNTIVYEFICCQLLLMPVPSVLRFVESLHLFHDVSYSLTFSSHQIHNTIVSTVVLDGIHI